ncbi:30S ribosomal protein S4 [Halobacteriales archaeon QH_8_68_33]|nr:MAG: 30S ribosomal protein S4 [Halobacteriales archaeon QH_8_68_33]
MALGSNTKFYETPNHPYQGERISEEAGLIGQYGLKNKEELWRARSELRFLARLKRIGVLGENDSLDDILSLDVTDILERRLQTVVYRKGLANTTSQARQFVAHGHITVDGRRVTRSSRKVAAAEEDAVAFDSASPLTDELHPERAEDNQ